MLENQGRGMQAERRNKESEKKTASLREKISAVDRSHEL
jgi:hypothetical protein